MRRILAAAALALAFATSALAQQFPNVPANTLLCRLDIPAQGGPVQPCPFASMQTILFGNTAPNIVMSGPATAPNAAASFRALVPADLIVGSGGGTINFLRADGTWSTPSGSGGGGLRPTLTAGTPVTESDVTGATSVICMMQTTGTAIYNGVSDVARAYPGDITTSLDATNAPVNTNYDLFEFWDSAASQVRVGYIAWSIGGGGDTARGTGAGSAAVHFFNARLTNVNQFTLRTNNTTTFVVAADQANLIGGFRTTGVAGQTEDSAAKRFLWSLYYPVLRPLRRIDTTATWAYTTNAYRQANASSANQMEWFHGVAGRPVDIRVYHAASGASIVGVGAGIGIDSTSTNSAQTMLDNVLGSGATQFTSLLHAEYNGYPGIGYHKGVWLELGNTGATFYGSNSPNVGKQTGITGQTVM